MSGPKVSIMLPAKDAAATLETAAVTCLRQSFENLELLLIENDSTPETVAIMEKLAAKDRRVRILRSEPGAGFIAALNLGWKEARGEFLARMDADDMSRPDRIARQVAFLNENPDLSAVASKVRILRRGKNGGSRPPLRGYADYQSWLNSIMKPEEIAAQRFVDSPVANPSAMIRASVFSRIGGYREVVWAEDYDFWLRMLENGMKIGKVNGELLSWFDSETRLTRNDGHYALARFQEAKAHFLARIPAVREGGVAICGAGPIGKRLARLLQKEGVEVRTFLEVSKRRIGNRIAGAPVVGSGALPMEENVVMLGAVGLPGGRERVREMLKKFGYVEGENFFCVA